jgi:hypothetical protein
VFLWNNFDRYHRHLAKSDHGQRIISYATTRVVWHDMSETLIPSF